MGLHAGAVALGCLISWTVVRMKDVEEPPLRVTADFHTLYYDPLVNLASGTPAVREELPASHNQVDTMELARSATLSAGAADALHLLVDGAGPAAPGGAFSASAGGGSATFVGLTATNARRIAYVIDASGSMITSMQVILEELARSLDGLSDEQSFGIVFFQRDGAVIVPPAGVLAVATPAAKVRALAWIHDNLHPGGRSNPVAAFEAALRLGPDAVFLLSENITGSGRFEIDQADLLATLERLNPIDRASGQRRTRINCVQFLYTDPIDTLRRIAERHGGARGYKFLGAAELGLAAP